MTGSTHNLDSVDHILPVFPAYTISSDASSSVGRQSSQLSSSIILHGTHTNDVDPYKPGVPTPIDFDRGQKEGKDEPYYHSLDGSAPFPECRIRQEDCIIAWQGEDDSENPHNWATRRKLLIMVLCSCSAWSTVFGSAVTGAGYDGIEAEFHVGIAPAALTVALFVFGFAVGPIVWGPFSEQVGRRIPLIIGLFGLTVFSFAGATAKDFQTLTLSRFFAGAISSATISVCPVVPADIFGPQTRSRGVSVIVLMIMTGPMFAPVIGGYISSSFLGWRWTLYILGIFSSFVLVLVTLFLPETYSPAILVNRAKKIRASTGNWMVVAGLETEELTTRDLVERTLLRPVKMLIFEPILLFITVYHGFIYGILYLCLECEPIIFRDYGWHGGNVYLPFLGLVCGSVIVVAINMLIFEPRFDRILAASSEPLLPEQRLPLMMICGFTFPAGIFLLCWGGAYHAMWFVPTLGFAFIGFSLLGIFVTAFNYIIDTYLVLAASGIAANTFLRSGIAGAMPIVTSALFLNLGTQWAGTLLGCLAALLAPIPFVFFFFGKKIRTRSRYAVVLPPSVDEKP